METVKKRGIIIYDLDIDGDTEEVFEIHSLLKEYADGFKKFVEDRNPKLVKKVIFEQVKSGVPMAERRGLSGEVKDIVFRGVRDKPNSSIKIPRADSTGEPLTAGAHKKLQQLRNRLVHRGGMEEQSIVTLLAMEADHMMMQYRDGVSPLKYSDDTNLMMGLRNKSESIMRKSRAKTA